MKNVKVLGDETSEDEDGAGETKKKTMDTPETVPQDNTDSAEVNEGNVVGSPNLVIDENADTSEALPPQHGLNLVDVESEATANVGKVQAFLK